MPAKRENTVKYMILTYGTQLDYDGIGGKPDSGWTAEDVAALHQFMTEFNKGLEESGELVETRGLAAPVHTRRLKLENGVPVATDGPYAETQEVLAGYWVVECASFDRATEVAAKLANCPGPAGSVPSYVADVRPVTESIDELEV